MLSDNDIIVQECGECLINNLSTNYLLQTTMANAAYMHCACILIDNDIMYKHHLCYTKSST